MFPHDTAFPNATDTMNPPEAALRYSLIPMDSPGKLQD